MKENKTKWECTCSGKEEANDYSRMKVFELEEETYQVDACLEEEIKYLLSMGIKTVASCCGHKRGQGFIAVKKESIEVMEQLGYERCINSYCPNAQEFFKPKTK